METNISEQKPLLLRNMISGKIKSVDGIYKKKDIQIDSQGPVLKRLAIPI